jgi:hypothetical protein
LKSPIELIGKTRRHLARIAALRGGLNLAFPFAITLALLIGFHYLRRFAWDSWGYALTTEHAADLRAILLAAIIVQFAVIAVLAVNGYLKANDYLATAARIDDHIGAHQEILTLATMTDPSRPETRDRRSPLFPMLWRRSIAYFDLFEPRREFRLQPAAPLGRSLIFACLGAIALGLGLMAMVQPPSALNRIARDLRKLASSIDGPGAGPDARDLAAAVRSVSTDLENPKLPPEQKQQELAALKHEVEKLQQQNQKSGGAHGAVPSGAGGGQGSGNSAGNGNGSGHGNGQSETKGQGGNQSGAGQGQANGSGQGGGSGGKNGQTNDQMVKLGNELDKAQARVAMSSGPQDKTQGSEQLANNGTGIAPKAGNNPNASGPQSDPHAAGNAELPKPGARTGDSASRSAVPGPEANGSSGRKDDTGSAGDTHLGEMPKPETFARFYAAGEGPKIQLHDARYTTFRIPTTVASNNAGGALVMDNGQPRATAPYTNVPLKQERITDTPDEQQLVPPRYRDLIH